MIYDTWHVNLWNVAPLSFYRIWVYCDVEELFFQILGEKVKESRWLLQHVSKKSRGEVS